MMPNTPQAFLGRGVMLATEPAFSINQALKGSMPSHRRNRREATAIDALKKILQKGAVKKNPVQERKCQQETLSLP